jgi:hypothetical protein
LNIGIQDDGRNISLLSKNKSKSASPAAHRHYSKQVKHLTPSRIAFLAPRGVRGTGKVLFIPENERRESAIPTFGSAAVRPPQARRDALALRNCASEIRSPNAASL